MRIDQAARALSLSRRAVYRLIEAGALVRVDVPFGGPRVTAESVRAFCAWVERDGAPRFEAE